MRLPHFCQSTRSDLSICLRFDTMGIPAALDSAFAHRRGGKLDAVVMGGMLNHASETATGATDKLPDNPARYLEAAMGA